MSAPRTTIAQQESLAAANDLTPAVWTSWHPKLVRTPRVLVPIELQVLMVRNPSLSWAATGMSTPPQSDADTSLPIIPAASLQAPLFQELAQPRARGAYLHWFLPRGLTGATADANGAAFPAIPDRWLVLRISAGSTPLRRAVTGWVIEAGGEPPVVTPLANWSEPGPTTNAIKSLTALGHGDLAWAGYFDNVNCRLGFHDGTLDGQKVRGPVAYLVCGWYADPSADPLGGASVNSLAAFNAKMADLGWVLDTGELGEVAATRLAYLQVVRSLGLQVEDALPAADYLTDGSWWPSASLLHAAVVDISWPEDTDADEAGGPPDPASIVVAAGDSMAETFAALIAQASGDAQLAPVVAALQLGVLDELDQADGRARLDVQLHTASFASLSGGAAGTEPVTIAPSGPPPSAPANPPAPGRGIFAERQTLSIGEAGLAGQLVSELGAHPTVAARPPGKLIVESGHSPAFVSEKAAPEGLASIIARLGTGVRLPVGNPGGTFDAKRAMPRLYTPKEPILLLQGAKRAFAHDSSVKTEDGMVVCRLTPVQELSWTMPDVPARPLLRGVDILESGIGNGSVPIECEGLLRETVLLDSGSSGAMAATMAVRQGAGFDVATAAQRIRVEQTAWYALRNPRIDSGPLLANSGIAGMLPAPYALAPAKRPWTPLELQWQVEFLPSPNGEADWVLGELDFATVDGAVVPPAGTGIVCQGRSTLTGGASAQIAAAVRKAVDDATRVGGTAAVPAQGIELHYSQLAMTLSATMRELTLSGARDGAGASVDPTLLDDVASALANMDVLSCGLNGILTQLRGGVPGDGHSVPTDGATPAPFLASRAGYLRILRLRLVDGFGQYLDLCGSDAQHPAQGYLVADPTSIPDEAGVLAQAPRYTAPARAWFRYMSADQPGLEADFQTSPVCGFLMPNHLDGSLEFFNADGSGAGSLQPDEQVGLCWQGAPGLPSTAGQDPASGLVNGLAAQMASALLDWGAADAGQERETALAALLRTIDSTLWSVDPFAHQGEDHLALLVGHPVCVLRAMLRLDLADPVVSADGTVLAVPVRLGSLSQWDDGLLGYYVNDDYTTLYVADAASAGMARRIGPGQGFLDQIDQVPSYYQTFADDISGNATSSSLTPGATPVQHPYVDTTGILWIRPNQTIQLTLLVEPFCTVHCTTGRVPRKEIGMRRSWVSAGLAAIAPTFRFGPVLVDPKQIRMPLATDLDGTWVWDYRADAVAWNEKPVTNATDDALLGADPPGAFEGWLKLNSPPPKSGQGS